MTSLRRIALAALISITAGCISHRERQHVYALDAALDTPGNAEAARKGPELQLQRVLVPDYLDTTDILLRVGAHEIRESSTGRFGERLSLGITHALRADLAARLPLDAIALAQPAEKSARQILVTVDVFDVWQNGRCVLAANWSILGADRRAVLNADRGTFITAPAGGGISNDAAIVSAMADAVRQLAERIASTVPIP
jgi:uncharacterized lipoprotein YmbA